MYEDEDYLGNLKDKPMQANELDDQDYPDALLGSHRALYGVECNLLASQFELHSAVYKRHQIVLLEVILYTHYYYLLFFGFFTPIFYPHVLRTASIASRSALTRNLMMLCA